MNNAKKIIIVLLMLVGVCILYWMSSLKEEYQLEQAYANAIEDAKTAEESEVYPELTAISKSNGDLIWMNDYVLVVTWTSWDGYLNKTIMNTTRETWVTAAPEVRKFINKNRMQGDKCVLRLEQLLGLPPHNNKRWFIEMWVKPEDLFRPTPNPEINDTKAGLDFPSDVNSEYKQWFNQLKNTSYGPDGYPWTRLGYTYDWSNTEDEVGLSEFVIKKDAVIEINKISSTTEYCNI